MASWPRRPDVERHPVHAKVVVLTLDAGANADGVASILGTLSQEHLPARFLLTGNFTSSFGAQAKAMAATGRMGDHAVSHPYFTKLTDAQITALGNAERLAMAAARAAEAEAKGITAAIRRADGLTELYMRQILEEAFRNDQVAVAQQKLVLAQLRREKERYGVEREVLEAKHSVEAGFDLRTDI